MNSLQLHLNIFTLTFLIRANLLVLFFILSLAIQAASGPNVDQLKNSLDTAWATLLKITNCDLSSPQDSLCIQAHHGKTINVKLIGQSANILILFETFTSSDISGPVITQQAGFLIGPFNGYGYKVIHERISYGPQNNRSMRDNGLKVFAHVATRMDIAAQGVELNKGQRWLDGKNEPWIYHWGALSKTNEALKELKYYLNKNYSSTK